jgi:thiol-disulfide isomerase/thioredoxin
MFAAPARIHAPELAPGEWLNTSRPIRLDAWRGRAVLVDIWDFTCLNCLRTLPYLTAWHEAYRDWPVSFLGIHTPEFAFARDRRQVEAALGRVGIKYPVLLDNDYQNWDAFANRYWPSVYLVDAQGYIRYQHAGEGAYAEIEAALSGLAREAAQLSGRVPAAPWPRPLGALRGEDKPGAMCFRATGELQAGFERGALGNPEGYLPRGLPMIYRLPPLPARKDCYFYAEGAWQAGDESLALAGENGALVLPYHAASANAVLAVSADPVDLMLGLKPPAELEITQDGLPLDSLTAGSDVRLEDGRSLLAVDAPRMYELARNPDGRAHELRLDVTARGTAVFAFSFSTCVTPAAGG